MVVKRSVHSVTHGSDIFLRKKSIAWWGEVQLTAEWIGLLNGFPETPLHVFKGDSSIALYQPGSKQRRLSTAWKVSKYGVLLVRIFPHSDWIRRDTEYLSVFSPNAGKRGKNRNRIIPNTDTFYAVLHCSSLFIAYLEQMWDSFSKSIISIWCPLFQCPSYKD